MAEDTNNVFTGYLSKFGQAYDRDVRGATSPFRDEIKPEGAAYARKTFRDPVISKNKNTFDLLSYQWYTSDIERRFRDDYYNNLDIDFAKNSNSSAKGLKNQVISTVGDTYKNVKDTVTTASNQIKDSVNNLINGPKKDPLGPEYHEYVNRLNFTNYLKSFPYAKIYEFKPRDNLGVTINALTAAFKAIDSITEGNGKFSDIMKDIKDGVTNFLKENFDIDFNNMDALADPSMRISGIPNRMYKQLISGYFTGYYEVPILDYNGFLNSQGVDGWESQSFMERFFTSNGAGLVKDFMGNNIGSGFDIATRPKWSVDGGGKGFPQITLEMVLFNDNIKAVFNNLAFIHSYVGGNLWYQDTIIQKCSSLYDVEVPGRFRYYFCKGNIQVDYIGKVRQIADMSSATSSKNNILLKFFNEQKNSDTNSFNLDVLNNIPDAYRLTFTFESLIPNNFNSYIAYVNQNDKDSVNVGKNVESMYESLANSIQASVTKDKVSELQRQREYDENLYNINTNP